MMNWCVLLLLWEMFEISNEFMRCGAGRDITRSVSEKSNQGCKNRYVSIKENCHLLATRVSVGGI